MKNNKKIQQVEIQLQALIDSQKELSIELEKLLTQESVEASKRSLYQFYKHAWSVFETVPFLGNWHLECICDHLEAVYKGEIKNIIFECPPRNSKSSIINIAFPVWCWLQDPTIKFITCAHGDSLAIRDSVKSRQLIESPWFQTNWGKEVQLKVGSNQKSKYENTQNGYRIATSISGRAVGEGFDILIVDDPHKPKEINSKAAITSVMEWWYGTMTSRANSPESKRVVMHQRLAQFDLIGQIRENDPLHWEIITLPMEYEPTTFVSSIGWSDPRNKENEILWPERFPPSEINRLKKELGEFGYAAQYQQRPVSKEGGIIKKDWIKYYGVPFTPYSLKHFDIIISSWDLAFGNTGDYTCGQVWGKKGPDKYLLDMVSGKWTFTEQVRAIKNLAETWPQIRVNLVENKANGAAAIDVLKKEVSGLIAINPKEIGGGDKEVRISACALDFESGNIFIPSHNIKDWVKDYVYEITTFPKARYDDAVDSTSQALNWFAYKASNNIALFQDAETIKGFEELGYYQTQKSFEDRNNNLFHTQDKKEAPIRDFSQPSRSVTNQYVIRNLKDIFFKD